MAIAQPVNQSEAQLISGSESTVVPQEHPTFGRWRSRCWPRTHQDVIVPLGFSTAISLTFSFYDVPPGAPGMTRSTVDGAIR